MPAFSPAPVLLGNRPAYSFLVQFPVVCFVATLVSDVAYWRTANFLWETFSVWLLTAAASAPAWRASSGCCISWPTGGSGVGGWRDRTPRSVWSLRCSRW